MIQRVLFLSLLITCSSLVAMHGRDEFLATSDTEVYSASLQFKPVDDGVEVVGRDRETQFCPTPSPRRPSKCQQSGGKTQLCPTPSPPPGRNKANQLCPTPSPRKPGRVGFSRKREGEAQFVEFVDAKGLVVKLPFVQFDPAAVE